MLKFSVCLMRYKMGPNVGSAVKRSAPDPLHISCIQASVRQKSQTTGGHALQQIEVFSHKELWVNLRKLTGDRESSLIP